MLIKYSKDQKNIYPIFFKTVSFPKHVLCSVNQFLKVKPVKHKSPWESENMSLSSVFSNKQKDSTRMIVKRNYSTTWQQSVNPPLHPDQTPSTKEKLIVLKINHFENIREILKKSNRQDSETCSKNNPSNLIKFLVEKGERSHSSLFIYDIIVTIASSSK